MTIATQTVRTGALAPAPQNPFGLAIDCFGANRPERLQAADLAKGDGGKSAATSATRARPRCSAWRTLID